MLNEEREVILKKIKERGTVYGKWYNNLIDTLLKALLHTY
jgi:hypothetical protein